jgi:hypothetical protein
MFGTLATLSGLRKHRVLGSLRTKAALLLSPERQDALKMNMKPVAFEA